MPKLLSGASFQALSINVFNSYECAGSCLSRDTIDKRDKYHSMQSVSAISLLGVMVVPALVMSMFCEGVASSEEEMRLMSNRRKKRRNCDGYKRSDIYNILQDRIFGYLGWLVNHMN